MLRACLKAAPAAAALLLIVAAGPSIAQGPPGGGPGGPGGPEALISQLRAAVRPTAAQQGQFEAVAQVMRENAAAEGRIQPPSQQATAVDQLKMGIQIDQMELDGMKRLLPAMEQLFAVLSPPQQRAADAVFARQQQGPPQR